MRGLRVLVILLLLLCTLPSSDAQAAPAPANLVVYHAHPDPRGGTPDDPDPMSTPHAPGPPAPRLPLTRFDGVTDAADAPEGSPESVPAHFREMQRLLLAREREGAGATLVVHGTLRDGRLEITARVAEPRRPLENATFTATLVEDGVAHDGASGVRVHRHVARATLPAVPVAGDGEARWNLTLDPAWDASRASIVVALRAEGGEALQSARWGVGQDAPTVQRAKAVLVERVTASWCVPCGPSDEALALLAARAAPASAEGGLAYARAPTTLGLLGLTAGLGAAWWITRRRDA